MAKEHAQSVSAAATTVTVIDEVVGAEIPTIDFSLLANGSPEDRAQAIRELGQACEEWGFFTVVNHGVTEAIRAAMMDACVSFFDLTAEEKKEYSGQHVMDPIRSGTSFNPAVEDEQYWRQYFKIFVHPKFHSPAKPIVFREISEDYAKRTRHLAKELLKAIWESLGLEENEMEEALGLDSCCQVLAGNLYLPCPNPDMTWGIPAHSDHGLITLLIQNGIDGLQVMHRDDWVPFTPLPNSFIVNVGDHIEIVSNGKYKSVLHRAKVNSKNTRISIPTVIGPSLDVVVVPAPQLLKRENKPAAYRGIKYREFLEWQQSNQLKEKSVLDRIRL